MGMTSSQSDTSRARSKLIERSKHFILPFFTPLTLPDPNLDLTYPSETNIRSCTISTLANTGSMAERQRRCRKPPKIVPSLLFSFIRD